MAASLAFISSNLLFRSWFDAPPAAPLMPRLEVIGAEGFATWVARPGPPPSRLLLPVGIAIMVLLISF